MARDEVNRLVVLASDYKFRLSHRPNASLRRFRALANSTLVSCLIGNGSVPTFYTLLFHFVRLRRAASKLATLLALPIATCSAIHFKVIGVSCRDRAAIVTFRLSPLRRIRNCSSGELSRFGSSLRMGLAPAQSGLSPGASVHDMVKSSRIIEGNDSSSAFAKMLRRAKPPDLSLNEEERVMVDVDSILDSLSTILFLFQWLAAPGIPSAVCDGCRGRGRPLPFLRGFGSIGSGFRAG